MTLVYDPRPLGESCNTNNHPSDITTEEYRRQIALTYKNEWIRLFPDPPGTVTIPIAKTHCRMLEVVTYVGSIAGNPPEMYQDELNSFEAFIHGAIKGITKQKWFIRFNEASPKDGIFGCGPVHSAEEIVLAIATSMRAHKAMRTACKSERGETLYLIPWRNDWNENLEFRVFIHNSKVTAFSQYVWSKYLGWTPETIQIVAPAILKYCNETIIPKMSLPNFVVDVIVVIPQFQGNVSLITKDTEFHVELIEFNSFGFELSSGSALFHWLKDKDILYGTGENVVVRYVHE